MAKCFNIVFCDESPLFIEAKEMSELGDLVLGLSRLCKQVNPGCVAYVTKENQFQRILEIRLKRILLKEGEELNKNKNKQSRIYQRRETIA